MSTELLVGAAEATTDGASWLLLAECRGADPSLFYDSDHSGQARELCRTCPVSEACLAAALHEERSGGYLYGIRGGMTAKERQEILRRRKRAARRQAALARFLNREVEIERLSPSTA